jgi:hypothetical protein
MEEKTSILPDNVYLFNKKEKTIKTVSIDNALSDIYYLKYRIPTNKELADNKIKTSAGQIIKQISSNDTLIPLYDVFTFNIYIVQRRNVYTRVNNHDYRFPDELIINMIIKTKTDNIRKLKKHPELENDKVFMRSIRKAELMIDFIDQLDLTVLYDTYLQVFYRYSPEIGNATYTCIRKSFIPHMGHLKPYYGKDEIVKLAMNMGIITLPGDISYIDFKDSLLKENYQTLCRQIQENDISGEILIEHQNYIVENNLVGLVQYYTIQGSFFINQYMRGLTKYEYRNDYLEDNIKKMWELVLNAPAFDNDYILYRFVSDDDYLKHLKIGDIFVEKGFISTTRDPFYRTDLYKFGFVLIKIRIPKNKVGVGLCLETLSHFPYEEEIILPPLANLKLISKNKQCEYYHPDEVFVANVKRRYEFEFVENDKIKFPKRPELPDQYKTQIIDFLSMEKIKTISIKERIDIMTKKYFDPMNRIKCKIGSNIFYIVGEWYDSTGAYADMYSIKTSDGFSLYSIYNGYILFMMELGEVGGYPQMRINYYTKYSQLDRQEIMGDDNFIKFVSSIAHYFEIPSVIIFADFMSCDKVKNEGIDNNFEADDDIYEESKKMNMNRIVKQRTFLMKHSDKNNSQKITKTLNILNKSNDKLINPGNIPDLTDPVQKLRKNIEKSQHLDVFTGGSYCLDFYKYLKHNIKRYENTNTLNVELQSKFSYHDLDLLNTISPSSVLRKEDRDEIYQIYVKNYLLEVDKEKDTVAQFYIWMIENKCYLMDIFIKKLEKLYRDNNPFKKGVYELDAMSYLYNRRLVSTYSRFIKINFDEEHQILNLPKNEYRIRR